MRITRALASVIILVFSVLPILAQTYGQISGTATDATSAVVADVTVSVTNAGTHEVRAVQTNPTGNYTVPFLSPGVYDMKVEKTGFKASTRPGVIVKVGDNLRIDFSSVTGENMSDAQESHTSIPALLRSFGIHTEAGSIRKAGQGITFQFDQPEKAREILCDRSLFAQGQLCLLHHNEVGGALTEFRSYRNGSGYSLHVVIDQNGGAFADLDRFNPYQSADQMVLHGVLELLPHLTRRFLKKPGGLSFP
jgi:hypothetical protein